MIIADATIWSTVLEGGPRGISSLVADLWGRRELSAPPAVFAGLLAETDDERLAEQIRAWCSEAPPVNETAMAWLSAGDLGAHLRRDGVHLSAVDAFLVALCLREGWKLWTMNSAIHRAAAALPIELFDPPA